MATIQSRLSRGEAPRYTVLELSSDTAHDISHELEARGIYVRAAAHNALVLMTEQRNQAYGLVEDAGYSADLTAGMTEDDVEAWLAGDPVTGLEGVLEPGSAD